MARGARPFFTLTVNWCVVALLLSAAYVVCYSVPLSGLAPDPGLAQLHIVARSIGMLLLTLSTLSAVLLVIGVIACLRDPNVSGRYIAWVAFACAMPFFAYVVVSLITWPMHRHALDRAARLGDIVVERVLAYEKEHGTPPDTLDAGSTSLAAYPTFTYTRFERRKAKRTLWWYDLGARHGRSVTSTWRYPDGEPNHAILAFELDGDGGLADARPDRLTVLARTERFTRAAWDAQPRDRQGMAQDILGKLDRKSGYDVLALLGEPDGERVLVDTPWELSVHTWPNDIDRFFYWPTQAYPAVLEGRAVTRVGDWAYARD